MTIQKLTPNTNVQIVTSTGFFAQTFIGCTGKIIGKSGLYRGAVSVKFTGIKLVNEPGDYVADYYRHELKVV